MKIALSSEQPNLDAPVDPRFGRCACVLIVETDDMSFEVVPNPYVDESGGVGTRLAALVARQQVEAVLTGAVGLNAHEALDAAGIAIITDCGGTCREAAEAYKAGKMKPTAPGVSRDGSSGGGETATMGRGRGGGGRGMGGGRGRGLGPCGGGRARRHRHGHRAD